MQYGSSQSQCPVDWDEGLKRVAGNQALFQKLLLRIASDLPNDLAKMAEALADGDMQALSTIAHTLKGSAGNLSITPIYHLAIDLEAAAKQGNISEVTALLEQMKLKAAEFSSYVNTL